MTKRDPARRNEPLTLPIESEPVVLSLDDDEMAPPEIMDAAGRLLVRRARTEDDLVDRLVRRGYDEPDIETAVASLKRLGLVDDDAYALEWIATRKGPRALGRSGLVGLLEQKGLDREAAEAAVDASGHDEEGAAIDYARASLSRLSGLSPVRQAAKLQRMLAGRGFEQEAVEAAIKVVTPPEGWD